MPTNCEMYLNFRLYSYQLADGTRRTEVGQIPNIANSGIYMSDERSTAERTALRMRARANTKNRKLSPKSLQSLAGWWLELQGAGVGGMV